MSSDSLLTHTTRTHQVTDAVLSTETSMRTFGTSMFLVADRVLDVGASLLIRNASSEVGAATLFQPMICMFFGAAST